MARTSAHGVAALLAIAVVCASPAPAAAKESGFSSPQGRRIYGPDERFDEVLDQHDRHFVIEAVIGHGPEGNLGMTLGWLLPDVPGLELYAGLGYAVGPGFNISGAARYYANLGGFRPFLSLGYIQQQLTALGTVNHNVFAEIGHKWVVHTTYHVTIGVGMRYIGAVVVTSGSPLRRSDVDPDLLNDSLDDVARWAPLVALRFSRAF